MANLLKVPARFLPRVIVRRRPRDAVRRRGKPKIYQGRKLEYSGVKPIRTENANTNGNKRRGKPMPEMW